MSTCIVCGEPCGCESGINSSGEPCACGPFCSEECEEKSLDPYDGTDPGEYGDTFDHD
jgi:hypothetical protein